MTDQPATITALLAALSRAAVRDHEKGGDGWRTTSEVAGSAHLAAGRARRHLSAMALAGDADHDQDVVHYWRWPSNRPLLRFLDFDARRDPKTNHFCIKCQRDLDPTVPFRTVTVLSNGSAMVVHPKGAQPSPENAEVWPIGDACAYRLGVFWTRDASQTRSSRPTRHANHPQGRTQ